MTVKIEKTCNTCEHNTEDMSCGQPDPILRRCWTPNSTIAGGYVDTMKCLGPCGRILPQQYFPDDPSMAADFQVGGLCSECTKTQIWGRAIRDAKEFPHQPALTPEQISRLKNIYGLTPEQYGQIYLDQNGCCPLCPRSDKPVPLNKMQLFYDPDCGTISLFCEECFAEFAERRKKSHPLFSQQTGKIKDPWKQ